MVNACPPVRATRKRKPTEVEPIPLSPALLGSHTLGHHPPTLTTPEQGPNGSGQLLCPRTHLRHSDQPILSLLPLPRPLLPAETTVKSLAHVTTSLLHASQFASVLPVRPPCRGGPPPLGIQHTIFSRDGFPPVCWPHHGCLIKPTRPDAPPGSLHPLQTPITCSADISGSWRIHLLRSCSELPLTALCSGCTRRALNKAFVFLDLPSGSLLLRALALKWTPCITSDLLL